MKLEIIPTDPKAKAQGLHRTPFTLEDQCVIWGYKSLKEKLGYHPSGISYIEVSHERQEALIHVGHFQETSVQIIDAKKVDISVELKSHIHESFTAISLALGGSLELISQNSSFDINFSKD